MEGSTPACGIPEELERNVIIQFRLHKSLKGRPSNGIPEELSGDGGPVESKIDLP